jgi:beta-glucosidase/6-phospho-beta-glucosidase/beta-galactosidase
MRWYESPELRFAVGFEDTFIPQTRFGERPLDEYEMTQHYHYWHQDLGLAAESGAGMVRWGVPWYRVNPAPGRWDWSWLDRVAERFAELGLVPIVDLMHYGTPTWLENEFANAAYPERVAEYAAAVAERYRGVFDVFTPLNEPLLNAIYCGEFGYWPPYLRGHDGLVTMLRQLSRGIVLTQRAIADVSAAATFVHVEASFRFASLGEPPEEMQHLRERAYVIQDLVTGRVDQSHALAPYLLQHRFPEADLAWLRDNAVLPDVMGVNYYPALSTEEFVAGEVHEGGPRDPRPRVNAWTEGLEDVLTSFANRYGRPVFLTETCWTGTPEQRIAWLDASVDCVERLRAGGVPVVGYTWWSLIDMYEWPYREECGALEDYHLAMGLWDLVPDGAGVLRRVRNVVADRYREHALRHRTVPVGRSS